MGWNLESRDLWKIINKFLASRYSRDGKRKECYSNGWRDSSDIFHFGMRPHTMYFAVRYDKNAFLSLSVTGGLYWRPNPRDRDYLVDNYLKPLFAELEPFIGLPVFELNTLYDKSPYLPQIFNIDFVWLMNKMVVGSMDTLKISQSPKIILSSNLFKNN